MVIFKVLGGQLEDYVSWDLLTIQHISQPPNRHGSFPLSHPEKQCKVISF